MKSLIFTSLVIGSLSAAQASITYLNVDLGQNVSISYNSATQAVFAGKLKFRDNTNNSTFLSLCCDIDNHISGGQTYAVNVLGSSSQVGGINLAGNVVAANFGAANTNEKGAALQLAVWEATYDGVANGATPNFSSGIFGATISGSLLTQATTYYNSITTPGNAIYYQPSPANGGKAQLRAVPEPTTMLALAGGLLVRRARRKK